jgi:NAD(P)-dependent dehydrogenase (short-subunit alcohol dehydrogenase family)
VATEQFSLAGKTALVIGGTSGIGREIALGYAGAGATVFPASRSRDRVQSVAGELEALGSTGSGHVLDANDPAAVGRTVDAIVEAFGALDILVNSQGVTLLKDAMEFTAEDYDQIMDTNLKSVLFACTTAAAHMLARGEGAIINIASLAAFRGWGSSAIYAASKAGVVSLTMTLAREWAERGVRVNAIAPGVFMTALNEEKMSRERKDEALRRTPMSRFGSLDELVGAAIYLASPAAAFTTGTTLTVDGGYLAMGL